MPYLLSGSSIGELYPKLLQTILAEGQVVSPRGLPCREVLGMTLHCPDLTQNILVHPVRDLNYRFMVAEWLWIMAGREDVAALVKYNREMLKFSDNGVILAGAYGPRLRTKVSTYHDGPLRSNEDQLEWCVNKLSSDPCSRQAVACIWRRCPEPSKDVPCTLDAQFFIRNGYLHAIWTMRSSDAWLGIPYDWFNFSMITNCLAGELGVKPGSLTLQLGSSHLYETNRELAIKLLATWQETQTVRSPVLNKIPTVEEADEVLNGYELCVGKPWRSYAFIVGSSCTGKQEALEVLKHVTS